MVKGGAYSETKSTDKDVWVGLEFRKRNSCEPPQTTTATAPSHPAWMSVLHDRCRGPALATSKPRWALKGQTCWINIFSLIPDFQPSLHIYNTDQIARLMSCIYTSGQTGPLQPKRHNVSISKQTSSGLAACAPGLEDVLIKLCDSQDGETVQKHNRGELSRKDSSTHNSPTRQKVGVWTSVGVTYFFTCSTSACSCTCT